LDFPFHQALKTANVADPSRCYFIDDNRANVDVAQQLGWGHCVHFCERGREAVWGGKKKVIGENADDQKHDNGVIPIGDLQELRTVWSEIFKQF
jgi:pyrimidine and pyridine-specific 5'-nucleotidase